MKKAVIIMLALTLLFSCALVSCGDTEGNVDTSSKAATSDTESQNESGVGEISLPESSEIDDTTSDDSVSDDTVSDDTTIIFPKSEGQLLIEKTDEDYQKECDTAMTTVEMVNVSEKYATIYLEIADDYYNRLMSISEEDWEEDPDFHIPTLDEFKDSLNELKECWETYYENDTKAYSEILDAIYGRGTIRGPIASANRCELCREWAVKIIYIYEEIEPISR